MPEGKEVEKWGVKLLQRNYSSFASTSNGSRQMHRLKMAELPRDESSHFERFQNLTKSMQNTNLLTLQHSIGNDHIFLLFAIFNQEVLTVHQFFVVNTGFVIADLVFVYRNGIPLDGSPGFAF